MFMGSREIISTSTNGAAAQPKSNYRYSLQADDTLGTNTSKPKLMVSDLWLRFIGYHTSAEFLHEVLWLFKERISRFRPDVALHLMQAGHNSSLATASHYKSDTTDFKTGLEMVINSPVTSKPSSVRGYHHDKLTELYAGLLYMRQPGDRTPGGHYKVMSCKGRCKQSPQNPIIKKWLGIFPHGRHEQDDPQTLSLEKECFYSKNTMVMFINSPLSVHAVSARPGTTFSRRYVNINADLRAAKTLVSEEDCSQDSQELVGCRLTMPASMHAHVDCW
mmetsp:Transcript_36485/g.70006  ORF Transcript_36485/g.70006 Transcript_36485/m.70006 type:complete len:276 (+) Transcript_36485:1472-2299(+)